jgi:hypothetical protein
VSVPGRALAFVFGVDAQRLGELVFQDDDPAGGFHRRPLVDQFPGPGRQPKLVARVAAVATAGAFRLDQFGSA